MPGYKKNLWLTFILISMFGMNLFALTPHETALVVNQNSFESISLANVYQRIYEIPQRNVIYLDLPRSFLRPKYYISQNEFSRHLWEPFQQALKERELSGEILAVLLSSDFPMAIAGNPPCSVQAGFYFRNRLPKPEQVKSGNGLSVLFSGSVKGQDLWKGTFSLDRYSRTYGENMPLPCASIGHLGARGNTFRELLAMYRKGRSADCSQPDATVLFLTNNDVRTKARKWQFPWALEQLSENVKGKIQEGTKVRGSEVIGIMAGQEVLPVSSLGQSLRPGALVDNLTSWGARFEIAKQTKVSEWLASGASASSGTVTEPYAAWPKFPHSSLFVHYTAGVSILESYAQSVAWPVQSFICGDALLRPFAPKIEVDMESISIPSGRRVQWTVRGVPKNAETYYKVYINDRLVIAQGQNPFLDIPDNSIQFGPVNVVVYAFTDGPIGHYGKASVLLKNKGAEQLTLSALSTAQAENVLVDFTSPDPVSSVELYKGLERLGLYSAGDTLSIPKRLLGLGASEIFAYGKYADGHSFKTDPVLINIKPPALNKEVIIIPVDNDLPDASAFSCNLNFNAKSWGRLVHGVVGTLGVADWIVAEGTAFLFDSISTTRRKLVELPIIPETEGYFAEIEWPGPSDFVENECFYIFFNRDSSSEYHCLYLDGRSSSLNFAKKQGSAFTVIDEVGYPFKVGERYLLTVERTKEGLIACVNGAEVVRWDGGTIRPTRFEVGLHGEASLKLHKVGILLPNLRSTTGEKGGGVGGYQFTKLSGEEGALFWLGWGEYEFKKF